MTSAVPETVLIEPRPSKATLIRLANSCARLASRGTLTTSTPQDIDAADYRIIAEVLRAAAEGDTEEVIGDRGLVRSAS